MNDRCEFEAFLEERLNDIDEFIQSELGDAPLNIIEPFTAPEIKNLSSMLETEGTSSGLLSNTMLGESVLATCLSHRLTLCSIQFLVQNEG